MKLGARRLLRINARIAPVVILVVLLGILVIFSLSIQHSGRPDKPVNAVLPALSVDFAYLSGDGWERTIRVVGDGAQVASETFEQPSENKYFWLGLSRKDSP